MKNGPFEVISYHQEPDSAYKAKVFDSQGRISIEKLAHLYSVDLIKVWDNEPNYAPISLRFYTVAPYENTIWQDAIEDPYYVNGRRMGRALIEMAEQSEDIVVAKVLAILSNQAITWCQFRRYNDPLKRCLLAACIGCHNHTRLDFHGCTELSLIMVSFLLSIDKEKL